MKSSQPAYAGPDQRAHRVEKNQHPRANKLSRTSLPTLQPAAKFWPDWVDQDCWVITDMDIADPLTGGPV